MESQVINKVDSPHLQPWEEEFDAPERKSSHNSNFKQVNLLSDRKMAGMPRKFDLGLPDNINLSEDSGDLIPNNPGSNREMRDNQLLDFDVMRPSQNQNNEANKKIKLITQKTK